MICCSLRTVIRSIEEPVLTLQPRQPVNLFSIATGGAALPVRALATWFAVGTHPRQTKHLSPRAGEPAALFDGLCEAGLPHTAVEIAREGFRKIGEPLCPFVALLCPLASTETTVVQDDVMPPAILVGDVPGWALTSTPGKVGQLWRPFCKRDCDNARWVRDPSLRPQQLNFLGTIVFRSKAAWSGDDLSGQAGRSYGGSSIYECHGPQCTDATEILQLMQADIASTE